MLYFEYGKLSVTLHALKVMGIYVADQRRWQSAMTSPIGDVGSERVKLTHGKHVNRVTHV